MKKRNLYTILILCLFLNIFFVTCIILPKMNYKKELRKITEATIKVDIIENNIASFTKHYKVSDFIENINGVIDNDYSFIANSLGEKQIDFTYINDEGIEIPYSYIINIVDDTPPYIRLGDTYTVDLGYNGSLKQDIMCGDDYDDNPKCEVTGKYNSNKPGKYKLIYKATDSSGNTTKKNFTLIVKDPEEDNEQEIIGNPNEKYDQSSRTDFQEVIKKYKKDNVKIGIDISEWQGEVDYKALASSGVEFVFLRVGGTKGIKGKYFLDKQFIRNIEGFNRVNIPVGLYFYSYASSPEEAVNDAKWLLEQIKGYRVDLPIAYDWENWSFYNEFHNSFYNLSNNAKLFLDTVKKAGYDGVLYSSKSFIDKIWLPIDYPIWVAHYTTTVDSYEQYNYWQLCSNGLVNGINGRVDIDIMYEK